MRRKIWEELNPDHVKMAFEIIQEEVYRENILVKGKRADGRQPADLRKSPAKQESFRGFTDLQYLPVVKLSPL